VRCLVIWPLAPGCYDNLLPVLINPEGVDDVSDASISLFQFRYDIDTIFTKYRDIDIDIDIKYVSKMHAFVDLNFNVFLVFY